MHTYIYLYYPSISPQLSLSPSPVSIFSPLLTRNVFYLKKNYIYQSSLPLVFFFFFFFFFPFFFFFLFLFVVMGIRNKITIRGNRFSRRRDACHLLKLTSIWPIIFASRKTPIDIESNFTFQSEIDFPFRWFPPLSIMQSLSFLSPFHSIPLSHSLFVPLSLTPAPI